MKDDLKEKIEYKGEEIKIFYDTDADSPDTWGNDELFLVYDHREFCVKRKGFDPKEIFDHTNETEKMFYKGHYVFPLYAYIHSGVSLSLGKTSYPFTDRWDTSFAGFVLVKQIKGWSYHREKALKAAESLVEEWNMYLGGEVYGYSTEHGSCWGFYGNSGLEEAISEAKAEIDYYLEEKQKEIDKLQYKIPFPEFTN